LIARHFLFWSEVLTTMKKILIVGAGYLQSFIIKRARELGYYTLAIDKDPNAVGFKYADEYESVDIVDQLACLRSARSQGVEGVHTAATDYGVLSAAYIAREMGLPGIDYEVAKIVKNKFMVRHILHAHGIDDMSQFYEIDDVERLSKIADSIRLPVMVKPCDGSGSTAASRVDDIRNLKSACVEAMAASLTGKAVIEDFIEGKEYGVESFVCNGEVHVLGVLGKSMTKPPCYTELGHWLPSDLGTAMEEKVKDTARRAICALGIQSGAVNMDVIVTKDGGVSIVDVGARMGGNLIGSHIIPLGTGFDYVGNLIRCALGEPVTVEQCDSRMHVVTRILALAPGEIGVLPDLDVIERKHGVQVFFWPKTGDVIRPYRTNRDGCGYVLAIASDPAEAENRADQAKQEIDEMIVRR